MGHLLIPNYRVTIKKSVRTHLKGIQVVWKVQGRAKTILSEELELRQKIAEAKAEERTYEEFDEEQNIDGMNDYLEEAQGKHTSTPFI